MKGRGSTAPTRGGATTAGKAPTGGTRGKTSPTKPAGTPGRGVSRGGSTTKANRTPGILRNDVQQSLSVFSMLVFRCTAGRHQNVLVFCCSLVTVSSSKLSASTPSAHKSGACSPTKQPTSTKPSAQTKTDAKSQAATPAPVKPAEPSPPADQKPSGPPNKPSYHSRLGLARVLMRKGGDSVNEAHKLYEEVISMAPSVHDAYIELADSLIKSDPMKAVDTYSKYPFQGPLTFDDAYIHGEMVRLLMKNEKYDDPRLGPSMISLGKVMGLTVLEKYVDTLDKTFKYSKLLMQVYAGVHGKSVDDPDLQQFFKFKCWV